MVNLNIQKINHFFYGTWVASFRSFMLFSAFLLMPFILGDVLATDRQTDEIAASDGAGADAPQEFRFMGDFPTAFVPEVQEFLHGPRSSWIALWTDKVELGRPLASGGGFSGAWLPTYIFGQMISDPWVFLTALSVASLILMGLFALLLFRAKGHSPFAGLVASILLVSAPTVAGWLAFPMFNSALCWSIGIWWCLERASGKRSLLLWIFLAFCFHSLLVTGYPQSIVFFAYMIGASFLLNLFGLSNQKRVSLFIFVFSSALVAVVVTAPLLLDLYAALRDSQRTAVDIRFFLQALPNLQGVHDLLTFIGTTAMAPVFGNPYSEDFPIRASALMLSSPVVFLLACSVKFHIKSNRIWWIMIGVLLMLSLVKPLFIFAVYWLGLGLSATNPIAAALIPVIMICAATLDALRDCDPSQRAKAVSFATHVTLFLLIFSVSFGIFEFGKIDIAAMATVVSVAVLFYSVNFWGAGLNIIISCLIAAVISAAPILPHQDPKDIAKGSAFIDVMKAELADGGCYATVGKKSDLLPANLNMTYGLSTLHSYNSLSPKWYARILADLGGDTRKFGRRSIFIEPDFSSTAFWMADIAVLLSAEPISDPRLTLIDLRNDVSVYRVKDHMGQAYVVPAGDIPPNAAEFTLDDPRKMGGSNATVIANLGDVKEISVDAPDRSLLILSQKFHPFWRASAKDGAGAWHPATIAEANGGFMAIHLPKGTTEIRMNFRPWTIYAWMGHVFWLCAGVLAIMIWWRRKATVGTIRD